MGHHVAPFFLFRSALPVYLIDGRDLNLDGDINDIPATAYRAVELRHGHAHDGRSKQDGDVQDRELRPVLAQSQLNLRVSKSFRARRPHAHRSDRRGVQPVQRAEPGICRPRNRRVINPTTGAAGSDAAAADVVLGRRAAPRAARRPDRVPVLVLIR